MKASGDISTRLLLPHKRGLLSYLYLPCSAIDLISGELFYIEAKGMPTPEWKLKLNLIKEFLPHRVEIYEGHYGRPSGPLIILSDAYKQLGRVSG